MPGGVAERHLDATVHLLDDGFQHLELDRDVDLVIVAGEDLEEHARTLPGGRLREPPDTLVAADAVLALDDRAVALIPKPLDVFRLRKTSGQPAGLDGDGRSVAVAGIARPQSFFDDLRAAGHDLAETLTFADHHRYSARDVERLFDAVRRTGAARLLTTEKDYVRLLPFRPFAAPVAWVPLTMEPDPLPEFRTWLSAALDGARDVVGVRVD